MSLTERYLGAIDQGTTSTRFMVFDRGGCCVSIAQREHQQFYPQPGWVEHDPQEILERTLQVISDALNQADSNRQTWQLLESRISVRPRFFGIAERAIR